MARVQATNRVTVADMPYTLHFDGTQRIALASMGNLGSSMLGAFSFGAWVKTTNMATTATYMFGCSNSAGGNFAFTGMTRTSSCVGKFYFSLRDNSGRTLSVETLNTPINTGEWTHVAVTKDATNTPAGIKMYINGISQIVTTVTSTGYADPIDFNRLMAIGSSLGSGAVASGWIGSISHPHFYTSELSPAQILNWYQTRTVPSGAFASYLNTEGADTSVADAQGNYNGTLTAAGQWSSTDRPYASRIQRQL